jgi:hypothetical protein
MISMPPVDPEDAAGIVKSLFVERSIKTQKLVRVSGACLFVHVCVRLCARARVGAPLWRARVCLCVSVSTRACCCARLCSRARVYAWRSH